MSCLLGFLVCTGLSYADDLSCRGESDDLKVTRGRFVEVCKMIGLKANVDK